MEIKSTFFGVKIIERPECPNDAVILMTEDDGNWFEHGSPFDAGWIQQLVDQLIAAKKVAKITYSIDAASSRQEEKP